MVPVLVLVAAVALWLLAAGVLWLSTGVDAWVQARQRAVQPGAVPSPSLGVVGRVATPDPAGVARVEAERVLATPVGGAVVRLTVWAEAAP